MIELCRHIKPEGTACRGPAVRGTNLCRHHQLIKNTLDKVKPSIENNGLFKPLPFLFPEDRSAIQTNVFLVINAFNRRRIDAKAASVMIYGFQVCLSNLNKGPLAQTDAENTVQRVILTPEGDEIAPPREKLEKDESPLHYKDCPCRSCAEQFRGAPPEQHHADCKCGLCKPIINECHPERSEGSAVSEPATASDGNYQSKFAVLSPEPSALSPAVRSAPAQALLHAGTLDPIQKEPNYRDYIYGDEIAKHEAQHAARVRAALEPEPDLGALHLAEMWDGAKRGCPDGQSHPDQPKEFKPYLTWGEEHDLKLAEMKRLREEEQARAREQAASAS